MSNETIESIEKLARDVVEAASAPGVQLDQRIEALKAITPIYTALRRHHKDDGDDGEDEGTFKNFQEKINATTEPVNGRSQVETRDRRGRRPS